MEQNADAGMPMTSPAVENKQKNENIKSEVENGITNLSIVDNEQKIQQSIKDE